MHDIIFYEDTNGNSLVYNYIVNLSKRTDKASRINWNKINDYLEVLSIHGTAAGEPFVKHLEGDIWELRPIKNRILFAAWINGNFILLHHFVKKTRKTPSQEINQAKHNLKDFQERSKKP